MVRNISILTGIVLLLSVIFSELLWDNFWMVGFLSIYLLFLINIILVIISIRKKNKQGVIINLLFFLIAVLFHQIDIEFFRSNKVLVADENDDMGFTQIILREDQSFNYDIHTFIGTKVRISGNYVIKMDSLFLTPESEDRAIPDTLVIEEKRLRYIDDFNENKYLYRPKFSCQN